MPGTFALSAGNGGKRFRSARVPIVGDTMITAMAKLRGASVPRQTVRMHFFRGNPGCWIDSKPLAAIEADCVSSNPVSHARTNVKGGDLYGTTQNRRNYALVDSS
jgi:hypothetical protein